MVDLITNSSTEIFICSTKKTLEVVNEILKSNKKLTGYEEPWIFYLNEFREWRKEEKKRIKEWSENKTDIDWDNKFRDIEGYFYDIEDEDDLAYLRKHYIEDNSQGSRYLQARIKLGLLKYKESDKWGKGHKEVIQNIYDEIEESEEKPEWWADPLKTYPYNNTPITDLDGKIIIVGKSDNSIPYEQFEWIGDTFNVISHHMG